MENKDQLNQIPEESKNDTQDEKTSKQETNQVEATQQDEEKLAEEQTVTEVQDETTPPIEVKEELVTEVAAGPVIEQVAAETPDNETIEAIAEELVVEVPTGEKVEVTTEKVVAEAPLEEKAEVVIEEVVTETPLEEKVEVATEDIAEEAPAEEKVAVATEKVVAETAVKEKVETTTEIVAGPPTEDTASVLSEEVVAETPPEKTAIAEVVAMVKKEAEVASKADAVADEKVEGATEVLEDEDEDLDEDENEDDAHEEEVAAEKLDYNEMSRDELIIALGAQVEADDVNKIKSKVALIKVSYLKKSKEEKEQRYQNYLQEGGDKEDYHPADDPLEEKFNQLFGIYKQKRAIFLENLEKEKLVNLEKKKTILEQLKELINSEETLKKTYDEFRALQDSWKVTGMVPKNEVNNLWQNYHFLVEMFFDKVKINKELKDLDLKKNLEQKIVLCEKAEELLLESSIIKSFKELQRLHEKWKEIGPAPDDKREEIWDRFKSTTEKINIRRRDHYKKMQDEQESNLLAKSALCEKAESLLTEESNSIKEWQNRTKQFNDLFKVWKSVGPAPKKQNDEIWERFKTSLDGFFAEKKDYFGKLKDQQVNNYNIKLDLCIQAEALKDSTEWRNATRDLINMQKDWREVGPVPRKHSDKIWKRFRSACDEFFNHKTAYFSNIKEEEANNLKKKEDLLKQVETHNFEGSKGDNLGVLKDFQRQWTDIGFVPFKEKDRLQNAFRDVVNKQLDKLNISNTEMSMSNYKSRFDVIKDSPDGDRQVYRERTFVQNKIAKMQEDILLWENNLGFLANSKKANLLKAEFEKKIEAAKREVEVLKDKIKFLNK